MKTMIMEDAVSVAPDVYRAILDNERVRVLDIRLKPGQRVSMHSHPDYVVYTLSPVHARFTAPSGEAVEVEMDSGETLWRPAEEHTVENIGTLELHVLNIELKEGDGIGRVLGRRHARWHR